MPAGRGRPRGGDSVQGEGKGNKRSPGRQLAGMMCGQGQSCMVERRGKCGGVRARERKEDLKGQSFKGTEF